MSDWQQEKSHSDETLLTAGFNLRTQTDILLKVPQGRHFVFFMKVSSLRDLYARIAVLIRRLKPAV